MFRDRVIKAQLAILHQHHDALGSELFADGRPLINGALGGGDVVLEVREAVARGFLKLAVADDGERNARDLALFELAVEVAIDRIDAGEGVGDEQEG